MAISPPSDLILDVAKAADPMALKEARNRLHALANGVSGEGFQVAFQGASDRVANGLTSARARGSDAAQPARSPGEDFEAMILTQFVETMLPDEAEQVFGKGSAGDIWKSMLAEQVAGQLAASGGVGIAEMINDSLSQTTHDKGDTA